MASTKPASTDFGAALSGLILGGSVLFLMVLAIVWLTNSHFEDLKASGEHGAAPAAPAQRTSPPAVPSTTGSGTQAPAAPSAAAPAGH